MNSSIQLLDIVDKSEMSIIAIREACELLTNTYGSGCENLGRHADEEEIGKASRVLIVHLSWLKSRAAALAMLPESSFEIKNRAGHLLR